MIDSISHDSLSRRSSHRSGSDDSQSCASYTSASMPLDWSQQDDDQLRHCISLPHSSWSDLAQIAFPEGERTSEDCMERWSVISKPRSIRGPWTAGEDALLSQLTVEMGPKDWTAIAKRLRSRSGKQCRERWHNHLDPTIKKTPFTPEEDALIFELYGQIGSKWAEMARRLPGRPDNAIKNHFNTSLQRSRRRQSNQNNARTSSNEGSQPVSPGTSHSFVNSPLNAGSARFAPYASSSRKRVGSSASPAQTSISPPPQHSGTHDRRPNLSLTSGFNQNLRKDFFATSRGPSMSFHAHGALTAPAAPSPQSEAIPPWNAALSDWSAASYDEAVPALSYSTPSSLSSSSDTLPYYAPIPMATSHSSPGKLPFPALHERNVSQSSYASSSMPNTPPPIISVDAPGIDTASHLSKDFNPSTAPIAQNRPGFLRHHSMPAYSYDQSSPDEFHHTSPLQQQQEAAMASLANFYSSGEYNGSLYGFVNPSFEIGQPDSADHVTVEQPNGCFSADVPFSESVAGSDSSSPDAASAYGPWSQFRAQLQEHSDPQQGGWEGPQSWVAIPLAPSREHTHYSSSSEIPRPLPTRHQRNCDSKATDALASLRLSTSHLYA